jgi:diguanylate cyclase (GGDEF)-like protein/PAS domain S-box-containing protein
MLNIETIVLLIISLFLLILVLKKSNQIKKLSSTCSEQSLLLDSINLPIFYKDKDGKFVGSNKAFEQSFRNFKQKAIKDLEEFKTTCSKEIELTYDNDIKKYTVVNFTNYIDGAIGVLFDTSKMKSDKTLLLKKKETLELVLKGSREGYWEWDVKTNAMTFSKRAKEILGYEENEKAPESLTDWMNIVESYDIARTNEAIAKHLRGESDFIDIEHRLKTSLQELWVNFRGKGTYNANNEVVKVYGTLRDITPQKLEITTLVKQRDLFMTFMDNLPAMSFIKDKQGRYIYVNSFYQKLLGFKEWKNKKTEEIFDKEISKNIINSDREAFYEGKHKHEEYIKNEEGVKKLFETYKFPIDSDKDKVLCGFGLDITQEKIYQEKIELYSKIFDNTNEAIILTDEKGITVAINKAFKRVTGYSDKEIIGKNPNIRQSGKHDREFYINMWKELLTKGSWTGEMFNKHKNGTIYPELMNINTITNEKNEVTNFVGIFQNIEQQKIIESRLQKMAHYDALTNLPNRTLFYDRLDKAIQRANRDKSMLSIIFLDLDNFKNINDSLGHAAGDIVLSETSKRLKKIVRDSDTVARLGGDEFVIILEKVNQLSDVSYIADKIIHEIKLPIKLKNNEECSIGISLGISTYPNQTDDKKELLSFADSAMYEAKESGKNCYKIYGN